jgi:hypothetical protein
MQRLTNSTSLNFSQDYYAASFHDENFTILQSQSKFRNDSGNLEQINSMTTGENDNNYQLVVQSASNLGQ